jgi:hypothetical protein
LHERITKMSDEEKQIRDIMARFSDGPESKTAAVQQLKSTLEAYLENGPGKREDRQQMLLTTLLEMEASFKAARSKPN